VAVWPKVANSFLRVVVYVLRLPTGAGRGLAGSRIEVSGLELRYQVGDTVVRALDELDLEVPGGQFLVGRGPSGSGKSSLIHAIAGLITPDAGRIQIGDTALESLTEREKSLFRRRNVGLVFQFFNLIPSLTVEMNVALPLLLDGKPLRTLRPQIGEMLERLSIGHRRHHPIAKLSGGEMQRIAIARALIVRPQVILADEPTGNLDSNASREVFTLLREQARKFGVTTIMMTHDVEVYTYCDRLVEIKDGRVAKDFGTSRGSPPIASGPLS